MSVFGSGNKKDKWTIKATEWINHIIEDFLIAGDNVTFDRDSEDHTITINASGGGGGGTVTDVKVNDASVVDGDGVAEIDLTDYAKSADLAEVATSGSYNDLSDQPTIPTVGNGTITLQKNGTTVDTFTVNQSANKTINMTLAKGDVGLGNADNTSDADKNVNSATKLTKTETVLQTNQVPYVSRSSLSPEGFSGYIREKLVGGSLAWNQKVPKNYASSTTFRGVTFTNNNDGSWTLTGTPTDSNCFRNIQDTSVINYLPNHVYYVSAKSGNGKVGVAIASQGMTGFVNKYVYNSEGIVKLSDFTVSGTTYGTWVRLQVTNATNVDIGTCTYYPMVVDLTLMFGTAIANYIYNLETATAGTGVSYLKSLGLLTKPYYEYDEGSLQSVCVKEKKITTGTHLDTIPLSDSELRGIVLKDTNNNLYYDGDEYTSDGKIKRKYKRVNMGTLNWTYSTNNYFYTLDLTDKAYNQHNVCAIYTLDTSAVASMADKTFKGSTSNYNLYVKDSAYTDAATFKAAMSGVYLVYELAEPTEETVLSYQNPQYAKDGTEEFVDGKTRDMIVPVGHVTEYMGTTAGEYQYMPTMPVDNGRFVMTFQNGNIGWSPFWVLHDEFKWLRSGNVVDTRDMQKTVELPSNFTELWLDGFRENYIPTNTEFSKFAHVSTTINYLTLRRMLDLSDVSTYGRKIAQVFLAGRGATKVIDTEDDKNIWFDDAVDEVLLPMIIYEQSNKLYIRCGQAGTRSEIVEFAEDYCFGIDVHGITTGSIFKGEFYVGVYYR